MNSVLIQNSTIPIDVLPPKFDLVTLERLKLDLLTDFVRTDFCAMLCEYENASTLDPLTINVYMHTQINFEQEKKHKKRTIIIHKAIINTVKY